MLGIVVSRADSASVHLGERLRALGEWETHVDDTWPDDDGGGTVYRTDGAELREFDGLHIELERPADAFDDPTLVVFASRHAGETGPLLTAHHTGNIGPAEFGGEPNRLARAAPAALAATLDAFDTHTPDGFGVGLECTHHGPTDVGAPSLFVEVGSAEPQWRDPAAATAVARTILALRDVDPRSARTFVGIGGSHYAPRFERIVRETDWTVGHIAADWSLGAAGSIGDDLIERLFDRSGAELAVVDGDRPELVQRIEGLGYRVVGESWLRETTGVPRPLIERLEAEFAAVDDGLRFGTPATTLDPSAPLEGVEPDAALLDDVNGIDAAAVRAAVGEHAVAYETVESGTRVAGRVVVTDRAAWERVEAALVELLDARYDAVTVAADEIVVTERAFDPERARALGVEPGPAFGRLSGGEPVSVDGEAVSPEAVHVTRTRRYPR